MAWLYISVFLYSCQGWNTGWPECVNNNEVFVRKDLPMRALLCSILIFLAAPAAAEDMPAWFKESFLDIREDVAEAAKAWPSLMRSHQKAPPPRQPGVTKSVAGWPRCANSRRPTVTAPR